MLSTPDGFRLVNTSGATEPARTRVFRSADAGEHWQPHHEGLPEGPFYPVVLRDAMCADDAEPAGVYFGTRSGAVFASRDEGESWDEIAAYLPAISSVEVAVLG